MSISSEITRISNAKTAIAESIANKGVTVPDGTKIDGMATLIDSIPTGGGGGNDEVYEITITDADSVIITSDYLQNGVKINLSDEAYNYIKTNAPRFLKISEISDGTYEYYFVLGDATYDADNSYIRYFGEFGGEDEPFHEFYLNDDEDDPKCLLSLPMLIPIIHDEIDENVHTTTKITPVSSNAVYNAIQALFTYDEATKTLNITPIGGGS